MAGTELDVGRVGSWVDVTPGVFSGGGGCAIGLPERNAGHRERSSGKDVPEAPGDMWDNIAAA